MKNAKLACFVQAICHPMFVVIVQKDITKIRCPKLHVCHAFLVSTNDQLVFIFFSSHVFSRILSDLGEYQNEPGKGSCKQCSENTKSENVSSTHCTSCGVGEKSIPGSAKCQPCIAGEAGTGRNGTCASCSVGKYRTSEMNADDCESCGLGRYQDQQGQATCFPCIPGFFASDLGAAACRECSKNTFVGEKAYDKECTECPIGFATKKTGSASCVACPGGTYGRGCQLCPQGKARNGTDPQAHTCHQCKIGETTKTLGSPACSQCDLGKKGTVPGECHNCDAGQYQGNLSGFVLCRCCFVH